MGQASSGIVLNAHVDTPVGGGLTSIMSEPIEELSADEFWAVLGMDLRNRRRYLWEAQEFQAAWDQLDEGDLLVQDPYTADYIVWRLDCSRDEATCDFYGGDAALTQPRWRGNIKVHRGPFRIEFWVLAFGVRESGGPLKGLMSRLLKTMNSRAGCSQDVDGLDQDGQKSVISDPIVDSILSPEMFWRQTKELIKKRAIQTLPDGSVVQKKNEGWADFWQSQATYTRHIFLENRKEIVSYTHTDPSMSEESLDRARHLRIHERPYRLEMWTATPDRRRAGEEEREQLLALLEPTLRQADLISSQGPPRLTKKEEAEIKEFYKLRNEVGSLRTEVCGALASIREGREKVEGGRLACA